MPIHDWLIVEAGIFYAFHHDWITEISRALNQGLLPPEYYSLPEQIRGEFGPDVLTLNATLALPQAAPSGGLALEVAPPKVDLRIRSGSGRYAAKAKAVAIRHVSNHRVVAMIGIVSPANKSSQMMFNAFVRKARDMLAGGVHLSIIDLFPPTSRDPLGIHGAVWADDAAESSPPSGKPLTRVAYVAGAGAEAFIDFLSVGDTLPDIPLFLTADVYVPIPLEKTYQLAWESMPNYWRKVLEGA